MPPLSRRGASADPQGVVDKSMSRRTLWADGYVPLEYPDADRVWNEPVHHTGTPPGMTEANHELKSDLRTRMRNLLDGLDEASRHDGSAAACAHLTGLDVFKHASVVMLYMPLVGEVDLTPAAIRCFRQGKTVCVPRVDWKRRDMVPVEISSFDDEVMTIDDHGLRTPQGGRPLVPALIDLVVVPGLAFDSDGNRLGRGGGFYDRFLRRLRRSAATVGLAFDVQIIDRVPADERDFGVGTIVTDRRVCSIGGSRTRS